MNDMEKAIWNMARIIKDQPELIAEAPAECIAILKAAYGGNAATSTEAETTEAVTETAENLTMKLKPQTPTPELIEKIKNIQQTQQEEFTNATDIARKYL